MLKLMLSLIVAVPLTALAAKDAKSISVPMKDAKGKVLGNATLTEAEKGVRIVMDLKGLPPGTLAFHIHEKGDCKGPDFKLAGGHYNPMHKDHGSLSPNPQHAGDMPNIEVGSNGELHLDHVNDRVTLAKGDASLLKEGGTALVIHAKRDDYKSQPAGDAGDRIVCGVVQ